MDNVRELTARLADLLRREHGAMADFLVQLAALDRRKLWRELGHASLFYFLHRELGLSKGAAHYRKTAAELLQRFPQIEAPLRDGRLCITSIVELAKVITPENASDVLPRFFHRSKREAKAVAAELNPVEAPPRRTVVTTVRRPSPPAAASELTLELRPEPLVQPDEPVDRGQPVQPVEPGAPTLEPPRSAADRCEPLTAELSRLHVTVSSRFLAKLEAARDALSHAHPGASDDEILEAGLDLILQQQARRRALVAKPRKVPPPSRPASRQVPAHVRRAVWTRDEGRCQYPLHDGALCGSTYQVEIDHIHPWALGGSSTIENTRLTCRPHNSLAARLVFGDEWMDRFEPKEERARERKDGA